MSSKINKLDQKFMNLAISIAKQRIGLTGNNPSVGCVVVKKNEIISFGQTGLGGVPHAESDAIDNSKINVEGSTLYSTLEPCCHYGKTPPCTSKIIKSKIKRVVYGVKDIDSRVMNKSYKIFKKNKIIVKKNILKNKIKNMYRSYFHIKKSNIPYISGKIAITNNNLYKTNKKYITNFHSLNLSHLLRYYNQGILVSSKTVNSDNPKLNCRINGLEKFSPVRIILDKNLNIKKNSNIFNTSKEHKTIVFYNKKNINFSILKAAGIKLYHCPINNNKMDIMHILKKIKLLGINYLLVEGGKQLTETFLKMNLFNEFFLFKNNKKETIKNINRDYILNININSFFKKKYRIDTYLDKDQVIKYY